MNAKIQRVMKEMEKTRDKIGVLQARLRDLEKQKTELENTEIISAVRGMDISLTELADMLKAASGQVGPNMTVQKKEDNEE
ncbi:DUF4315 family protein [Christensenella intestinihominis]|uniref:DUF4315 family protein n=1 Tax=Christensenella intestinihominis TaxID=1851429 RepID=UPI00082C90AA|nr:DUF4315 family protein [Christensenella intestinihominis]